MTTFLRPLADDDKAEALQTACARLRQGQSDPRHFEVAPEAFDAVPGKPFAYWVSEAVRGVFERLPACQDSVFVTSGTGTLDDFRFLHTWWEVINQGSVKKWFPFAKGGAFAPIYYDHYLSINWVDDGAEMKAWIVFRYGGGHWARNIRSTEHSEPPRVSWRPGAVQFEALQAFELELIELRDTLLKLAPTYKPNHDDGVQISAAPLWPLFRYKPWQNVLKDTWAKLEKGDYDWARLAMNDWPDRVREKCKTDKSLAIAHGLGIPAIATTRSGFNRPAIPEDCDHSFRV